MFGKNARIGSRIRWTGFVRSASYGGKEERWPPFD